MDARLYAKVTQVHNVVLIVGSGPSAKDIVPLFPKLDPSVAVIAVNQAVSYVPRCNYFFTLDPSPKNRDLMRHPRRGVTYYVAVPPDYGETTARIKDHRDPPEPGIRYLRRVTGSGPYSAAYGLSDDPASINTGNSMWGALQLAVHMKATRIGLIGLDGKGGYAWESGKPNSLEHLPGLFNSAVPALKRRGIKVRNGNVSSMVNCFTMCGTGELVRWLMLKDRSPEMEQMALGE